MKTRYQVWKDCELGQTYFEKEFSDRLEAWDYIDREERYNPGWHYRAVEIELKDNEIVFGYPGNAQKIELLTPNPGETSREYSRRCYRQYLRYMNELENPGNGRKVYMNEV